MAPLRPRSAPSWSLAVAAGAFCLVAIALAAPAAAAPGTTLHVDVTGATFTPKDGVVLKGGSVTWERHESNAEVNHIIHATDSPASFDDFTLSAAVPTKNIVFNTAKTIPYVCQIHANTGTVVVDNPPTVAFTSPPPGTGFGTVSVTGTASDPDGDLAKVTLTVDGVEVPVTGTDPWSATVDLGQTHGASRTLVAKAFDVHDASASASRTLTVNQPPSAAIAFAPAAPTSRDIVVLNGTHTDDHTLKSVAWAFGDGGSASSANTTHRFPKGTWTLYYNVSDDHDAVGSAQHNLVVANSAPQANFTLSPPDPAINDPVTFTDASEDFDLDAANWTWDFGDSTPRAFTRNATHAFATPGLYNVNLTIRDAEGASTSLARALEVVEFATARPVPRMTTNKVRGIAPLTVDFTLGGHDPDGSIASWNLTYGDATTPLQGTGAVFANNATFTTGHTYQRNGTFEAVLTVVDNIGATATNRTRITVDPPPNRPPVVRFEVAGLEGGVARKGKTLQFVDASTDADFGDHPAAWEWRFGDGGVVCCDKKQVTYVYTRVGSYTATLKVTDTLGAFTTLPLAITIAGDPPSVALAPNTTQGRAPQPVSFTVSARDLDGRIERWSLDFGDGSPFARGDGSPPNQSILHLYEQAGSYAPTFEAVDDDALAGRVSSILVFAARLPEALQLPPGAISVDPTGARLTYRFTATTTLAGNVTYQWAFGDGRTGVGRTVEYSYLEAGSYNVALTVQGPEGPLARASTVVNAGEDATTGIARVRTEVAEGVVRVAWSPDARAAGYQVWRRGPGEERFEEVAVVTGATSYEDLDVEDGKEYTYQVTFFSATGDGRLSRLTQLNSTEAFRRLGEVRATGLVDTDGDGTRDSQDAFPQDAGRISAGPGLLLPVLLVLGIVAAAAAYKYRARLLPSPPSARPLTDVPGLLPEYAAILQGQGITTVAGLAAALPADLARRTVLPRPQLEAWVATAQLMQLPGIAPSEAAQLAAAGVLGLGDLARAEPTWLSSRLQPPPPMPKLQRWIRTARQAMEAG